MNSLTPVLVIIFLISLTASIKYKCRERSPKQSNFNSKRFLAYFIPISVVAIAVVLLVLKLKIDQDINKILPLANQHFNVVVCGEINDRPRDLTLMLIENSHTDLINKYPHDEKITIQVFLYKNIIAFQQACNKPTWVAAAFGYVSGKPCLFIPCGATDVVIKHEVVHALIGVRLGERIMNSIPRWFNEGIAEYEERENCKVTWRANMWLERSKFIDYKDFASLSLNPSENARSLFYDRSYELVLYMHKQYGDEVFNNVLLLLDKGSTFETAVDNCLSCTPELFYNTWYNQFFG